MIGPSSPGKAAAILEARDPGAALQQNELSWGRRSDGGGGVAPLAQPSQIDTAVLAHDQALMQAFGFPGTPGIVYFDARGQAHGAEGVPGAAQLAQIVQAASVPVSATPAPGRRAAVSPR